MSNAARGFALAVIALQLFAAGCAATVTQRDYDPWEGFNRDIFWFNDKADEYVLEPVAKGWDWAVPKRVEQCVHNFFYNMRFPINFVNNILQGDGRETAIHLARFMVNTTIGLAGLFDPATDWGLVVSGEEDFGQTLGVWGIAAGPYLMVPIFGPSTLRDVWRYPVDGFISGIGFTGYGNLFAAAYVVDTVNFRAENLDTVRRAKEASLDYYSAVRSYYLQRRQALINDTNVISNEQNEDLYNVEQYENQP